MKKISLAGVVLGMVLGIVAAMISGTWIFWLASGLALGVVIGATSARRARLPRAADKQLRA